MAKGKRLSVHWSATLLWAAFGAALNLAAPIAHSQPRSEKQRFESSVMKAVNDPANLQTDVLGSAWVISRVLDARYADQGLYKDALRHLANIIDPGVSDCSVRGSDVERMSCAATFAARSTTELYLPAATLEFLQDSVTLLAEGHYEETRSYLEALVSLAESEWLYGATTEAVRVTQQATEASKHIAHRARDPLAARVAILQMKVADAFLDDARVRESIAEAFVEVDLVEGASSDSDLRWQDLAIEILQGRVCSLCTLEELAPLKIWLDKRLNDSSADANNQYFDSDRVFLYAAANHRGMFSALELRRFALAAIARLRSTSLDMGRIALRASPGQEPGVIAKMLCLRSILSRAEFLQAKQIDEAIRLASYEVDSAFSNWSQFGAVLSGLKDLAAKSELLALNGKDLQSWAILENVLGPRAKYGTGNSALRASVLRASTPSVLGPMYARLSGYEMAAGRYADVRRTVTTGLEMVVTYLEKEWERGTEDAITAWRDLRGTLESLVDKEFTLAVSRAADKISTESLFAHLQILSMSDTALAVETATLQRLLKTPELAAAKLRRDKAAELGRRIAEIEGYHGLVNFEGAITNSRLRAEEERTAAQQLLDQGINDASSWASPKPVASKDVVGLLKDRQAFVVLHPGPEGLLGLMLSHDGSAHVWRVTISREELSTRIQRLRSGFDSVGSALRGGASPAPIDSRQALPFDEASEMYELLFGSVRSNLAEVESIVLVADGCLASLPFSTLLPEKPQPIPNSLLELRARRVGWLIRKMAITIVPSVRTFVVQQQDFEASRASRPLLGIGAPEFARLAEQSTALSYGNSLSLARPAPPLENLRPLPETADEVRFISVTVGAKKEDVLLGREATKANLLARNLKDYRIVIFATHGLIGGDSGLLSEPGLALTPGADGRDDNGFLGLSDILGLRLDANLVILSACNTASSDGRPRADALSGLARGFFSAGARTLLVTHWSIPSNAATNITTGLMTGITVRGLEAPAALREAILAVMDEGPVEWAHPVYWGAYELVGATPLHVPGHR